MAIGYGCFLADITNFDDLADWLESHINETLDELEVAPGERPKQMLKIIKDIIENTLEDEIEEYGWTGDEEIYGVRVVNMFHKAFLAYNKDLYLQWFVMNYEELEEDNPYANESPKDALNELKQMYREDGVELTEAEKIGYMKRGISANLLSTRERLEESITYAANDVSVENENKVSKGLEKILNKIAKMDKEIDSIESDLIALLV